VLRLKCRTGRPWEGCWFKAAVTISESERVFGGRQDGLSTFPVRPASEKRQVTKSRWVGPGGAVGAIYGDLVGRCASRRCCRTCPPWRKRAIPVSRARNGTASNFRRDTEGYHRSAQPRDCPSQSVRSVAGACGRSCPPPRSGDRRRRRRSAGGEGSDHVHADGGDPGALRLVASLNRPGANHHGRCSLKAGLAPNLDYARG
jgi:hypothetical protein